MISMRRKEACSGSIHDFAHIPTPNCLSDCLTKASAKADNLITAVKTEILLDVDTHGAQGLLVHLVQNIYAHKGELMNFLLSVASPSSSFVTVAVSIPHCVVKSDRLSMDDDWLREHYLYEAFAFSRHSTNLELDEEIMKPEKASKEPRNSGVDPSTMKMKQWYQGQDLER